WLIVGMLHGPAAIAQTDSVPTPPMETSPKEAPPTVEVPAPPELTAEAVQKRRMRIESAEGLDEGVKKSALEIYDQALEQLRVAEQHAARVKELERLREQAPATVSELQAKAAQPVGEPTIDAPPDADVAKLQQGMVTTE